MSIAYPKRIHHIGRKKALYIATTILNWNLGLSIDSSLFSLYHIPRLW